MLGAQTWGLYILQRIDALSERVTRLEERPISVAPSASAPSPMASLVLAVKIAVALLVILGSLAGHIALPQAVQLIKGLA